jgi:hypothetical protein
MVLKVNLYFDLPLKTDAETAGFVKDVLQNTVDHVLRRIDQKEWKFTFLKEQFSPELISREEVIARTLGATPKEKPKEIPKLLLKEIQLLKFPKKEGV